MNKIEYMAMGLPHKLKLIPKSLVKKYQKENYILTFENISIAIKMDDLLILRPISDLIKPCLEGGLIPIVELSKIAGLFGFKSTINNFLTERWEIGFKYLNEDEYFYLNDHEVEFHYIKNKTEYPIRHQFQLFQKLIEWHFDIAGLIDKNEAIDYTTLEGFSF
jgi:hypothetical protein